MGALAFGGAAKNGGGLDVESGLQPTDRRTRRRSQRTDGAAVSRGLPRREGWSGCLSGGGRGLSGGGSLMGRRGKRSSRGLHRGPSPRRERASRGGLGGTFSPRKGARSCYARIDGAQESGASRAAEAEGRRARGALQRQFLDDQLEPLRVPARVGHWHGVGCGPLRVRPVSVRPVEPGPLVGERRVGSPAVQRAGGVERGAPSVGVGVPDPGRHLGDVLRTTANKRGTEPGQTDHVGARQRSLPTLRPQFALIAPGSLARPGGHRF